MSVLGQSWFFFFCFRFCLISAPRFRTISALTQNISLFYGLVYADSPPKGYGSASRFSVDMTSFHLLVSQHKCFLHSRKWCTVAVAFKMNFHVFLFFQAWCWCESQYIHLIGWNISLRDPWDLSIYSFVTGLLMLQFEGKQKWKIILEGSIPLWLTCSTFGHGDFF